MKRRWHPPHDSTAYMPDKLPPIGSVIAFNHRALEILRYADHDDYTPSVAAACASAAWSAIDFDFDPLRPSTPAEAAAEEWYSRRREPSPWRPRPW